MGKGKFALMLASIFSDSVGPTNRVAMEKEPAIKSADEHIKQGRKAPKPNFKAQDNGYQKKQRSKRR